MITSKYSWRRRNPPQSTSFSGTGLQSLVTGKPADISKSGTGLQSLVTGYPAGIWLLIVECLGKTRELMLCNKKLQKICKDKKMEIQERWEKNMTTLKNFEAIEADKEFLMGLQAMKGRYQTVLPLFFAFNFSINRKEYKTIAILSKIETFEDEDHECSPDGNVTARLLHGNTVCREETCKLSLPFYDMFTPKRPLPQLYVYERMINSETHSLFDKETLYDFKSLKKKFVPVDDLMDSVERKLKK